MSIDSRYKKNNIRVEGDGFIGLLQIVFIVLKLCHVIDWSWIWVLTPTLFYVIMIIAIICIMALILYIKERWEKIWKQ